MNTLGIIYGIGVILMSGFLAYTSRKDFETDTPMFLASVSFGAIFWPVVSLFFIFGGIYYAFKHTRP